ncbi:head-tail connector protein [Paucilactobacillus sp. N302-9]
MSEKVTYTDLLQGVKDRLHIFNTAQDDDLQSSINASVDAIKQITGFTDETDTEFIELVNERVRYSYNDSLEYFEDNFSSRLMSLSLKGYKPSEEGDSSDGTE